MDVKDYSDIIAEAEQGISKFFDTFLLIAISADATFNDDKKENILDAKKHTLSSLKTWLEFPEIEGVPSNFKDGIVKAVEEEQWEDIVNAFRQEVRFGTGGIRGMMAYDYESIVRLKKEDIGASILKGPNTINDLVFSLTTAGVARYGEAQSPKLERVVIGYDSRIRGFEFARIVAQVFLGYGYTVYFFDAPCPYPEVTYAIPHKRIKADIGVLISASHNDYRYNGYKLSCSNGSQFDPTERDDMYDNYISAATVKHIKICTFEDAPREKLIFLGGKKPVKKFDYAGRQDDIINMHELHRRHVQSFLLTDDLAKLFRSGKWPALNIAYCAFHGVGFEAVPRLLAEVGFDEKRVKSINGKLKLNELDGLFPAFCSDPGHERQPDPGDSRAAEIAVSAFKEENDGGFDDIDILIGTDPDADRCGVVIRIPEEQRHIYDDKDYYLLPADDMWALVLWYRLHMCTDVKGRVEDADRKFVVLSHTTSDAITALATKVGLGYVRTWVGFASLAAATRDIWEDKYKDLLGLTDGRDKTWTDLCHPFVCDCKGMDNGKRSINVAAMEQSNGFSILGGPPDDARSLGKGGHVRDKDGTFAALLVAEIAAWAKSEGTTILELLDKHIYLDPQIGLFATFYEPDPMDGEYPGFKGDQQKREILDKALYYHERVDTDGVEFAGYPVKSTVIYRTGKYDNIYPPSGAFKFPDEGIRFFFDEKKVQHVTIRPSGTGNSLRFHIQLHSSPAEADLVQAKEDVQQKGRDIMDDLREKLGAPRGRHS